MLKRTVRAREVEVTGVLPPFNEGSKMFNTCPLIRISECSGNDVVFQV